MVAKVEWLLREPLTVNLHDVLLPAPAGPAGATLCSVHTRHFPDQRRMKLRIDLRARERKGHWR